MVNASVYQGTDTTCTALAKTLIAAYKSLKDAKDAIEKLKKDLVS